MLLSFADVATLPPLRALLRRHGATLLLAAAVRADFLLCRECGLSAAHCAAMADEAGGFIAEAVARLGPTELLAAVGHCDWRQANRELAEALPTLLLDVLKAMLGRPAPGTSLYAEAFTLIHDYGRTCECVGATADWLTFMQYALQNPANQ